MTHRTRNRPAVLTTLLLLGGLLAAASAAAPGGNRPGGAGGPPAPARPAPAARDFSGKYLAEGGGDKGRPYKAMVEITRLDQAYQVVWVLGPNESYAGVGLANGDVLSVGWLMRDVPAVIVYQASGDQIVGRWTAGANGQTYKETLTPVK